MKKMDWQENIEETIAVFQQNGAVILRNAIPKKWIEDIAIVVDQLATADYGDSMKAGELNDSGKGRFFSLMFPYAENPEIADFLSNSDLPEIAACLMKAEQVRYFFSHLLIKEANTESRTPWHQDRPYWPILGDQILGIWIPFDHCTPESGVVTYVKGSHKWGQEFEPESFKEGGAEHMDKLLGEDNKLKSRRSIKDIDQHPEDYEFISWDMQPGDILLHHSLCVHGAQGNANSEGSRRALATRWLGDDARWDLSRTNNMKLPMVPDMLIPPTNDHFDQQFPLLWK